MISLKLSRRVLAAAAGVLALSLPLAAEAHRAWMVPNATNFSGEDPWVSIDGAISNDLFFADHNPLVLETVTVTAPDGTSLPIENGVKGRYRSTFDVHLVQPGTTRIAVVGGGVMGTYVVDGVTFRMGRPRGGGGGMPPGGAPGGAPPAPPPGQPQQGVTDPAQIPANATDIKLVQSVTRMETFVTRGAPTPVKPTGVGLELSDAGVHPTDLVADEPATFKLLLDGKPAAGVTVAIEIGNQRYVTAPAALKLTTGADGSFTVKWPTAGVYWLNAVVEGGKSTVPNATRRAAYTAILEVQKP